MGVSVLSSSFFSLQNAKNKRNLTAKIEMAKFLQKTIEESAVEAKKKDGQTVESFGAFIEQVLV